jgi:hypothetical protein
LRYGEVTATLRFGHGKRLLDALPSLIEIFRLGSYKEHIPLTLLNLPSRASSDLGLDRGA